MPNRVTFLIDGFNLYHSIRQAMKDDGKAEGRWLDIKGLCQSFLGGIGPDSVLSEIFYFSAYTKFKGKDSVDRHRLFVRVLQETGVKPVLGRFKAKEIKCRADCKKTGWGHEEKETDVNIAVKPLQVLMQKTCDTGILVTGDTDLAAALRAAKEMFPERKVGVGFPYGRGIKKGALHQLADITFDIQPHHYRNFLLPDQFTLPSGTVLKKPTGW